METGKRRRGLVPRYTTDAGEYLFRVGEFLRRRPVEHSVLLSTAPPRVGDGVAGAQSNLWVWVEDDDEVVATAQHTPPHGAFLSTGAAEAICALAGILRRLRPGLPGVTGLGTAAQEFATEWSRLGGPQGTPAVAQALYAAEKANPPIGVPGGLRPATRAEAPLLRGWADHFLAEAGATSRASDEAGPRIDAGLLYVWEAGGAVVSMAGITVAQGGVSRVGLIYTPPENRKHGFASACVAAVTDHALAIPGRTCILYTDLPNPTSDSIYQDIGYRRVADAVELTFATPGLGRD